VNNPTEDMQDGRRPSAVEFINPLASDAAVRRERILNYDAPMTRIA
jgi:hypothetical protein